MCRKGGELGGGIGLRVQQSRCASARVRVVVWWQGEWNEARDPEVYAPVLAARYGDLFKLGAWLHSGVNGILQWSRARMRAERRGRLKAASDLYLH